MATIGLQCSLAVLVIGVYFCLLSSQPTSARINGGHHGHHRRHERVHIEDLSRHSKRQTPDILLSRAAKDAKYDCIPRNRELRKLLTRRYISKQSILPPASHSFYSVCPAQAFGGALLPVEFKVGLTTFVKEYKIDRGVVSVFAKTPNATIMNITSDSEPVHFKLFIVHTSSVDDVADARSIPRSRWISFRRFTSEDVPLELRLHVKPYFDSLSPQERNNLQSANFAIGIQDADGNLLDWRNYLSPVTCVSDNDSLKAVPEPLQRWNINRLTDDDSFSPTLHLVSNGGRYVALPDPSEQPLPLCPALPTYTRRRRRRHN